MIEFKNYDEEHGYMDVYTERGRGMGYVTFIEFDPDHGKWVLRINGTGFSSQALRKIADKLDQMGYEP